MHSSNAAFALKPKEIKELIFACDNLRERIMIKLMAYSGLRREEVANLKIEKIDWERNRISFIGKNRLPGTVPVSPDLIQDIQFYLTGRMEGPVFPSRKNGKKNPICLVQVNRIVSEVGKRAGIKNPNPKSKTKHVTPHLLRHSFARMAKDSGLTVESVQKLLRHASFKTTMDLYGTMSFEDVQEKYEEKFLAVL
jgi:integrase/recombinase XerD